MKTFSTFFLSITILVACSPKIPIGKYLDKNSGDYIDIDKDQNYTFIQKGGVHNVSMYSKGKLVLKDKEISFLPDTSLYFKINIAKHYFDPSLFNKRKIILNNRNNQLSKYYFYFNNSNLGSFKFGENIQIVYDPNPPSCQEGFITVQAKLNDSLKILPRSLNDSIFSNTIHFIDVDRFALNDGTWNTLELNVNITRQMFDFTTLYKCIIKKNKIIKKDWPVYEIVK